ncbi:error-prone DNA polymerase [uncultured Phenylobacterium sp.]|uniref:error-prone DNA polymerase n=1 Tax=uncultured Phenylobacterium sp. TaxID=349273 RepID=UPI0025E16D44|nr:error-prone DNA polymerase [uncultured Phenylobacterium sp.]
MEPVHRPHMTRYAELQVTTNFSFLRGASHPWEFVAGADALGIEAVGICDRNSLAGVVRAWRQMQDQRETGSTIRALTGCRLEFADGTPSLIVYPSDREAYGRLTRLLTTGQLRSEKGNCELHWEDFAAEAQGQLVLVVPPGRLDEGFEVALRRIAGEFPDVWLAAARGYGARDLKRLSQLAALSQVSGAPMVATNDVLYHGPERRPLQDVLTCIRETCTIHEAGLSLAANAERHLKAPAEMARLFARFPGAVERSVEIAERIGFDLGQLRYEYPDEPVPPGKTAIQHLRDLAWAGADWRYPGGVPEKVTKLVAHELDLIEKLDYPNYFLTVHDIVDYARNTLGILCQGRGSAANSCVCYCLGVTAVDPTKEDQDLLFSRFISENRGEPPDIDVDFEHERREEVMQYVYQRYGRHRAAIVATVIHYRPRMAIRQVGKALGLTEDITAALANTVWGGYGDGVPEEHIRQAGLDPTAPEIRRATALAQELLGFPRHLSQHVGGYVLTKRRLDETVPIGNAAMDDRTFLEWDKDDIDALKLMKVDILALGMLSALRKSFALLPPLPDGTKITDVAHIPQGDAAVYDMLCKADSVGVFQVESRAQMSMLPRLKPRKFYDLVVEVAIVRPGPIQGDMVHPYLKRRAGIEPITYPRPGPGFPQDEMEGILGKTFGVPLFQEQPMRVAIVAAEFTADEADRLRRSMATTRNAGTTVEHRLKFVRGMVARGYDQEFAERCFKQIEGFGSYGFPESHAISFAILVYVSAWVKWHHPDAFLVGLLNSLPMGFYQPAQLVRDAREHGVEVRPPDVSFSDWDCTLEARDDAPVSPTARERCGAPEHLRPVRLGLRQIKGFKEKDAEGLATARAAGARTIEDYARKGHLTRRALELLAEADAFRSLGFPRREALWAVKGLAGEWGAERDAPLLLRQSLKEDQVELPFMTAPQHVAEDYRTTSLSLKDHPVRFFREDLAAQRVVPCMALKTARDRRRLSVGGIVLVRQRPGTAQGVVFMTLEDETGIANIVVWRDVFEANRRLVMTSAFLVVHGQVQAVDGVVHVVAERFTDLSARLAELHDEADEAGGRIADRSQAPGALVRSRDFH